MAQQSSRTAGRPAQKKPRPARPAESSLPPDGQSRIVQIIDRRPVHWVFTTIFMVLGGIVGGIAANYYVHSPSVALPSMTTGFLWFNLICITVLGILLGFLVASTLFRWIVALVPRLEFMPIEDKVAGIFGVMLGLIIAVLLQPLASKVPYFSGVLVAVIYLLAISFGVLLGISMKKELVRMFARPAGADEAEDGPQTAHRALPKLMDTNVVIDGRILEVWNSGFIEGDLLVPQFVLDELQTIADSADDLKRARGRRGLDLLNRLKEEVASFRVLRPRDYAVSVSDAEGVDSKLVKLAGAMEAALLTNDFNLSKVAELQGIPVLNVNRLVLALKPVVMAGEELRVNIIRHGRDPGQGVAYLDDGTMVVVEDGEAKVGRVVDVVVTSMLQTVAGKMIFAVLKESSGNHGNHGDQGGRGSYR